jgi:hypothetical protein
MRATPPVAIEEEKNDMTEEAPLRASPPAGTGDRILLVALARGARKGSEMTS